MKKIFFYLLVAASLYACGSNETKTESAATEKVPEGNDVTRDPAYAPGLELIAKSDCLTCHKINEASTGPSYASVASKYPNTPETLDSLASKVIKGGSGHWGAVPMTPHPTISVDDAKTMVKYVMLFKK